MAYMFNYNEKEGVDGFWKAEVHDLPLTEALMAKFFNGDDLTLEERTEKIGMASYDGILNFELSLFAKVELGYLICNGVLIYICNVTYCQVPWTGERTFVSLTTSTNTIRRSMEWISHIRGWPSCTPVGFSKPTSCREQKCWSVMVRR